MHKLVNSSDVLIKIMRIDIDTFLELMHLLKHSGSIWDDQRSLNNTRPPFIRKASEISGNKDQGILFLDPSTWSCLQ